MSYVPDMKEYAQKPFNVAAAEGIEKAYALVMSKPDTRYVACSDPEELARVRENFLKKKLGLTAGDLDGAIKAICEHMKDSRSKSRVVFYYCLAEHFGKLDMFVKK